MKVGDKVKVVSGEFSGRMGWIHKINLRNNGIYARSNLTIMDEHKHTYIVSRDNVVVLEH
ncbi:MAG: KOW motif-containing protein [Dehalococcoidia bacterium]|nr:MAG: KOW motif-containing protein [Dehalococcoidia bacterium]